MSGGKKLALTANAKLNLYLDITGTRGDGYHLIETVMQSVSLSDIVTIETGRTDVSVSCSDPLIPDGEDNICHKAALVYLRAVGSDEGAEIRVEKRIPSGAGMGGGSADAAAVLLGLNRAYGGALTDTELSRIAAEVGADVPFCLCGGTKLCKGIGEIVESAAPISGIAFLAVKPPFSCSTKEAYARYDSAPVPARNALGGFEAGERFYEGLYNVFEELYADERISRIKRTLIEAGALGASLTGSGSAVFGVFESKSAAASAARHFAKCFTAVCEPLSEGISFSEAAE